MLQDGQFAALLSNIDHSSCFCRFDETLPNNDFQDWQVSYQIEMSVLEILNIGSAAAGVTSAKSILVKYKPQKYLQIVKICAVFIGV